MVGVVALDVHVVTHDLDEVADLMLVPDSPARALGGGGGGRERASSLLQQAARDSASPPAAATADLDQYGFPVADPVHG